MCVNKQISCPPLTSPVNGYLEIPCLTHAGGVCRFSCSTGYQLIGSDSIFCQESGTWSSPSPTCSNGQVTYAPTSTAGTPGVNCGTLKKVTEATRNSQKKIQVLYLHQLEGNFYRNARDTSTKSALLHVKRDINSMV